MGLCRDLTSSLWLAGNEGMHKKMETTGEGKKRNLLCKPYALGKTWKLLYRLEYYPEMQVSMSFSIFFSIYFSVIGG